MGNRLVNIHGLLIRKRRVLAALLLIVFGIAFFCWGSIVFYIDATRFTGQLSDSEIMERARKLGMVELKEYLQMQSTSEAEESKKNQTDR